MAVKQAPSNSLKHLADSGLHPAIVVPKDMRPLACLGVEAKLSRRYGDADVEPPKDFNPQATYREIASLYAAGALDRISAKSLRQAPWVLFYDMPRKPSLGEDSRIAMAVLKLFAERGRPSLVLSMLHCFLRDYPEKWPTFDLLRIGIAQLLEARNDRRAQTLERVRRHFLLDKGGPARLSRAVLGGGDIAGSMAEAKLTGELEAGRFTHACFAEMCQHTRNQLEAKSLSLTELNGFLAYAASGDELRFPSMSADLANALLEPLDVPAPSGEIQSAVQAYLLRHLRDPRLVRDRWLGVSETAKSVMLRWLVGATLEDFFHVLDRTAPGTEEGRRWTYRKAFWGAYNKKRLISDAWIALGSSAKDLIRRGGSSDVLRYGNLEGATATDCLLLLRIGNLTIAEWSHTGSCRVWRAMNKAKPEMYRYRYTKIAIVNSLPDETVRHGGAQSGLWQSRLATYIRRHTGAEVRVSDYMPRGASR